MSRSSPRWDIRLERTRNAAFSARATAGKLGRRFSTKMRRPARLTLPLIPATPIFYLPRCGRPSARRGAWIAAGPAAGFLPSPVAGGACKERKDPRFSAGMLGGTAVPGPAAIPIVFWAAFEKEKDETTGRV